MKPLIIQVLKDPSNETMIFDREEFQDVVNKAYEQGVEDGQNKALADIYREQWLPYKYITYPTCDPINTGDYPFKWTCDTTTTGSEK